VLRVLFEVALFFVVVGFVLAVVKEINKPKRKEK
jgi:hypothetical protein